jgi:hypothetical protein
LQEVAVGLSFKQGLIQQFRHDIGRNMRLSVAFDNITEMHLQRLIDESETPGLPLLANADSGLTTYDRQLGTLEILCDAELNQAVRTRRKQMGEIDP